MYVTQEQLHKELVELEGKLTVKTDALDTKINQVNSNLESRIENVHQDLQDFKFEMSCFREEMNTRFIEQEQRFDQKLADWLVVIRTDIENFKIVIIEEMKRESQLQRYYFQKEMEVFMVKQREQFNADITRHMMALGEEYQWRLSAVGEKVDLTWEKCERKYVELDQKDLILAEKVALLEEYLPTYPRNHKGKGQSSRIVKENKKGQSKNFPKNMKTKKK